MGSSLPVEMAIELIMKGNNINVHGLEHYFLVPGVLLTSYYNVLKSINICKKNIIF